VSRKEEILDAALSCFNRSGIEKTSIEMICEESSASVGSLYHHFSNKQGVVAALFVAGIGDYHCQLQKRLKSNKTAEDGVRSVIYTYINWVSNNSEQAKFVLSSREEIFGDAAQRLVEEENQKNFSFLQDWFRPYAEDGTIQDLSMELFLSLLLGPVQLYAQRWINGKAEKNITKHKDLFFRAAWASVSSEK